MNAKEFFNRLAIDMPKQVAKTLNLVPNKTYYCLLKDETGFYFKIADNDIYEWCNSCENINSVLNSKDCLDVTQHIENLTIVVDWLLNGRIIEPSTETFDTQAYFDTGKYDKTGCIVEGTEVEHRIIEPKNTAYYVLNTALLDYGHVYGKDSKYDFWAAAKKFKG